MTKENDIITKRNDRSQVMNYNNPLFYCFADKHFYSPEQSYTISEHWHEDMEFMYIIEGSLEYSVNGENIHLNAGEGIFVNTRRIHANYSPKGEYCVFLCIIVHPSYLSVSNYVEQKFIAPMTDASAFDYLLLSKDDWTGEIIDILYNLFEYGEQDTLELEILESCFKIMRLMYHNIDLTKIKKTASNMHVNTFKEMMMYIQNHYMEKVALEEIAAAGNVGKTLCTKIFKHFVQSTPTEYLIKYRITKSLELLTGTEMSITDIAYATGFTSASHFTKTFREQLGYTPNKYRNSNLIYDKFKFHKVSTL